jgi:NarL family two-component system response regulator LiaR
VVQDGDPAESSPEPRRNLRVIVAQDDPFARRMIREALERASITVVAEAQTGRRAVDLVLEHRPDAVIMDVALPDLDGLDATRQIVSELPDQVVIVVSRGDDDTIGLASLRAGAAGYLTKDLDVDALPRAVHGAVNGEAAISRRLGMRLVERLRGLTGRSSARPAGRRLRPTRSPLTPREWEVVELLADAKGTDEIAALLQISTETVRSHIKHILRKLDARSRAEAVVAARRLGDSSAPPGIHIGSAK